ncbi:MAG: 50S ribosomal protein L3 [Thermoproteota archaeon]|jgi:large subunit ribosomal protein L3|nr:50S ribosomal protein L3 [Thermoproteota archaeon]
MGHRKYSAPRRGSIAFRPRARAKSLEARVRTWPQLAAEKSSLLGFAGFKAGGIQILTVDDREKTPNFGKQLLNAATVIATPPMRIIGIRGYKHDLYGQHAIFDVYAKDLPKELSRKFDAKSKDDGLSKAESLLDGASDVMAVVAVSPNSIGLAQKVPFVFEVAVSGKNIRSQYDYVRSILGKEIKITDVFQIGQNIDVFGITRGKGIEGPITRFGVKRKQHKSRKSVRAVGTLGPISPAVVMYTVARQGQRGFHQRTEYNKRILVISNTDKDAENLINPSGGFKHFGLVRGDYIVVRGSVPGVPKRLVKMRQPIRAVSKKVVEPKVLEVVVR